MELQAVKGNCKVKMNMKHLGQQTYLKILGNIDNSLRCYLFTLGEKNFNVMSFKAKSSRVLNISQATF